ncbi:MAG: helicase-related protein, partial [Nanoarchaeota archaeon]
MTELLIPEKTSEPVVNLVLHTLENKKQALVFVNAKRSAEKVAEDISKKINSQNSEHLELAERIVNVLSKSTRQCERLAMCVKKGIAFHHSGLASKQRELIEDNFRKGTIKIICCTPTLSMGIDLPAFRSIIRDVKRYSERKGMDYIPVLEYLQMAGRAGRPKFDDRGEAIIVSSSQGEKDFAHENYILGEPEAIYSKLSVEPVLRTYILSLISSKIVQSKEQIEAFFSKTFWAHQYKDLGELFDKIEKMINLLTKWEFITPKEDKYEATYIGKRVAELYVDPLTADKLIVSVKRAGAMSNLRSIALVHAVCNTLEMRPLLNVKTKEYNLILEEANKLEGEMIDLQPSMFESEYEDWLNALKTALMLNDWMEENDEEYLL